MTLAKALGDLTNMGFVTMISALLGGLLAKILIGGGILAYLYSLYYRFKSIQDQLSEAKAKATITSDLEKVAEKAKIANEEVRDFNDAVDAFNVLFQQQYHL